MFTIITSLNINFKANLNILQSFIAKQDLNFDKQINYACIIKENNEIIACACSYDNVFKMIAINANHQGEGLVAQLITHLINHAHTKNIYHYFIFTKNIYHQQFINIGFSQLVSYQDISLYEMGNFSFTKQINIFKDKLNPNLKNGLIIINGNPFTLGHYHLIQYAASKVEKLLVLVVESDFSYFSFKDRFYLIKEGCKDLPNVIVLPSGPYVISQATFPTYFLKDVNDHSIYHAYIDGLLSLEMINSLNIEYRFVGEEPNDVLTNLYNQTLKDILKDKLIIIPRIKDNDEYISASLVRKLLLEKEFNHIKKIVPLSTYTFLLNYDADSK